MLYYENINNKHLIFLEYDEKKINGWIHYCYLCDTKTSRLQLYNNSKNKFVIICKDCKKHFENKTYADIEKFIDIKINKK